MVFGESVSLLPLLTRGGVVEVPKKLIEAVPSNMQGCGVVLLIITPHAREPAPAPSPLSIMWSFATLCAQLTTAVRGKAGAFLVVSRPDPW